MHPKNWLTPEQEDSIGAAHLRTHALFERHLAEAAKPWKRASRIKNGAGKRLRRRDAAGINATMLAALKHEVLWLGTYVNHGALDEQISNRVRDEARHFWNAKDEASIKLVALAEMGKRIDLKLEALSDAFEIINQLDFQKFVINDAVPWQYRLQLKKVAAAIKQALAA